MGQRPVAPVAEAAGPARDAARHRGGRGAAGAQGAAHDPARRTSGLPRPARSRPKRSWNNTSGPSERGQASSHVRETAPSDRCPYPGLRPFRPDEADLFFGRDEQVDELLDRLGRGRFLAVVGESGCGKSSLILAGMIPALETGFLDLGRGRGGRDDAAGLAADAEPGRSLLDSARSPGASTPPGRRPRPVGGRLAAGGRSGWSRPCARPGARPARTSCWSSTSSRRSSASAARTARTTEPIDRERGGTRSSALLLRTAAEAEAAGVYVVLTMRSDFLGDCACSPACPRRSTTASS